jgi:hypothetical protein
VLRPSATVALRALPLLFVLGFVPLVHGQTRAVTNGCEITAEEYAVYSSVLSNSRKPEEPRDKSSDKHQLLLSDETATSFGVFETKPEHANWRSRMHTSDKPSKATSESFNSKAHDSCLLKSSLELTFQYALVPGREIRGFFEDGAQGWSKFYEKYPWSSGYWEFSRVGFDNGNREAVVYLGRHCGGLCGTGNLVLLRKVSGKWVVKNSAMLWIS